jgi:phage tail sheath protein FI
MPEYLSPGVYIEEQDTGPEPISGVSTSTTGFVGMTVRGPITGPPTLVTSFPEFVRNFGGYLPDSATFHDQRYLPYAVRGFFENLGQRAYIVRVPGTGKVVANDGGTPVSGLLTRLAADAKAGDTTIQLATTRGIVKGTTINLRQVKNGLATTEPAAIAVASYTEGTTPTVTLVSALANNYQAQYTTVITNEATPALHFQISAKDPGAWGNSIGIQIKQSTRTKVQRADNNNLAQLDTVPLASAANFYAGAIVEFNTGSQKLWRKVKSIAGSSMVVDVAFATASDLNVDAGAPAGFALTTASTCEFDITASYGGVSESYRFLTMDNTTLNYYGTVLANNSNLLVMTTGATPDLTNTPFIFPSAPDGLNLTLINGVDGTAAPTAADYIGTDNGPGLRTGIQALTDALDISIEAVPGITDQNVINALITHCETLKYRFAILDSNEKADLNAIKTQRDLYDTKYAALYYPRISIYDPLTDADVTAPVSGHMAGIYARVDNQRGVWKAPANEILGAVDDLEFKLSKGDQDELNPEPTNICVLRDFRARGRGLRVYGARCITSVPQWKYINVRRLFIFLEASLDQGTQWVVFEPNDQKLWNRLIQSVSNFLTTVWREGGLMGSKPEEAFFVKCGLDTMTLDDRENGRLIMIVGVAPVFPAEFVIIRIGQWAGGSSVQEL